MKVTIDKVIEAFIKTRDAIDDRKRAHTEELAEMTQMQNARMKWLETQLRDAEERGLSPTLKCAYGTVFYTKKEAIRSEDWETTLGYIIENQRWDLLTKALNKTAALEIIGQSRDITKLPGASYVAFREVSVRRS